MPLGAMALSFIVQITSAAPGSGGRALSLSKRANTFVGCDNDQRHKAGQAAADMANLAMWAYEEASLDK